MMPPPKWMTWFWQLWLASVVFVFPIPHTIALRNLLLLVGVTVLLATLRGSARPQPPVVLKSAAWGLGALTAWLIFHSLVISPSPAIALDNVVRGDWLMPLLTAVLAAFVAARAGARQAILAVIAALLAHMLWMLGSQFLLWQAAGTWPFKLTPFGSYDYHGTLNSFLLALLVTERSIWLLSNHSPFSLGKRTGWAALLLSLVSDISLQSRNSTAIDVAVLVTASLVLLGVNSRHWRSTVFILTMVTLVAAGSLSFDSRWQGLRESSAIGWSSSSLFWLTNDSATRPATPSGAALEESAYLRVAWARQAVEAIVKQPLGAGFGRDGFGRAIDEIYARPGMVSSHSGWLDFALGAGLPGLALLLLTAGLAIRGGWRQFRQYEDGAGLMLSFLVGSYLLRCLIDGHFSGWRLGLFAFLCGVLIAAMKSPRQEP